MFSQIRNICYFTILISSINCDAKNFHQNLWKTPVKKLIFLSCRLGIYSFTKNRKFTGVLKGFWLHPPLTRLQTAIFKLEVLLSIFCGTKITLIWTTPIPLHPPPPLTPIFRSTPPPPIMPYPPINIEMFSTPPSHYSIFWRLHTPHLLMGWGGGRGWNWKYYQDEYYYYFKIMSSE